MKNQSVPLQRFLFFVIAVGCVVPPLFVTAVPPVFSTFPTVSLALAVGSGVLLAALHNVMPAHRWGAVRAAGPVPILVTCGVLCISAAVLEAAIAYGVITPSASPRIPDSGSAYGYAVLSYLCGALYEETLYRWYVPETLIRLLPTGVRTNGMHAAVEATAVVLFAAAHRYIGAAAVVHATCAGCALRWCFLKTHTIVPGIVIHAVYNCTLFALFVYASA
ncbi:MAG: CPBP family intramembrane metalloprotease [Treponema sp.]|nr:CPBP family intramembrane metalloprotease [Treponema sp.]